LFLCIQSMSDTPWRDKPVICNTLSLQRRSSSFRITLVKLVGRPAALRGVASRTLFVLGFV
jgi:hypothetical protein